MRFIYKRDYILVVHVTLVKPSVMQKLDGMNIIIYLKVENHRNNFKTIAVTNLHGLLFQMPKNGKIKRNVKTSHIALWNPDLDEQKDFERLVLVKNGIA